MFGPISFWRWKNGKHAGQEDENTYVFSIEIVNGHGSDLRQTTDVVPAVALFNASSEHSWISKRFAQKLGIIQTDGDFVEGQGSQPIKLAWRSKTLGRYIQRTVFMIAPFANFDVLFAEMQEENKRDSEPTFFQRGIEKGAMKKLEEDKNIPRVDTEASDDVGTSRPTIAQLDDLLLQDTEGHKAYHRIDACNTRMKDGLHACSIEKALAVKAAELELLPAEAVGTNLECSSESPAKSPETELLPAEIMGTNLECSPSTPVKPAKPEHLRTEALQTNSENTSESSAKPAEAELLPDEIIDTNMECSSGTPVKPAKPERLRADTLRMDSENASESSAKPAEPELLPARSRRKSSTSSSSSSLKTVEPELLPAEFMGANMLCSPDC
ncbi:hypothetical protein HYFRA_00012385 [Hymenoscyphus fraxineus]|uniref:Uncharacterized protein n=1 Tax=Hymenoscyphus fraxineus TaxID=746836 RepID=A0A9N9L584_9HELO|nr:hypothetical protein HYFRA_00012385 [Hymenoscyphus fraxineus]